MIIAVPSQGEGPESPVSPKFGRCQFFLLYDTESKAWTALNNSAVRNGESAGIKAAQALIDHQVQTVIARRIGGHAAQVLQADGIRAFRTQADSVRLAVDSFLHGERKPLKGFSSDEGPEPDRLPSKSK